MANSNDRFVNRRPDGDWVNKLVGGQQASSLHATQQEAMKAAREMLNNAGGGEMSVTGLDGRIRIKDTVGGGSDPCPPRDSR